MCDRGIFAGKVSDMTSSRGVIGSRNAVLVICPKNSWEKGFAEADAPIAGLHCCSTGKSMFENDVIAVFQAAPCWQHAGLPVTFP